METLPTNEITLINVEKFIRDELIAVATASCSERGKTLLALVGEVLVERLTFKGDVPLIPYVLSMWVRRMAVFSSSL